MRRGGRPVADEGATRAPLRQVGYQSHSLTEMSNRTQDNALDVRQALVQCGTSLADLHVCPPAPVRGAAVPPAGQPACRPRTASVCNVAVSRECLARARTHSSRALLCAQRFMGRNELRYAKAEIPFPVQRPPPKSSLASRFGEQGERRLQHMPDFLPALPPQHSYMASVKQTGPRGDAKWIKKQKHKERQQIEQSLHKMAASASGKASKKRPSQEAFGAEKPADEAEGDGVSSAAAQSQPIEVQAAEQLNDVLAEAGAALASVPASDALPEPGETEGAAKARHFSLSLPSKDATSLKESDKLHQRTEDRKCSRCCSSMHYSCSVLCKHKELACRRAIFVSRLARNLHACMPPECTSQQCTRTVAALNELVHASQATATRSE